MLQNSTVVLVGKHTRSSDKSDDELYDVSEMILFCEITKFLMAMVLEMRALGSGISGLYQSLKIHVFDNPMDSLKIAVPAALYLLQNTLLYVALSNLSAPMFQVTYQSKLLTTAFVSVLLLKRRYAFQQWVALGTLGVGVAIVILSEKGKSDASVAEGQSLSKGLVAVVIACLSSALAGVYTEMILKNVGAKKTAAKTPSLWMRNIQMAFISVCIAIVKIFLSAANETDKPKEFMQGFTFWVWVLISLQAGGGLLVAAIIKYADNVLKGLATGVAVAFSTFCSMILFGTPLTPQFALGSVVILSSVYVFSTSGKKPVESNSVSEKEMTKPILPK